MKTLLSIVVLGFGLNVFANEPISCGLEGNFWAKCRASFECAENIVKMNCEDQGKVARILKRTNRNVPASQNEFGEFIDNHCVVTLDYECN